MSKQKSGCSKFSSFLKNMDYFGVGVNFQFKNGETYNSVFGAIIFIFFFVFSVVYLTINFIYFVNREWMNLVFNEGFKDQAPQINFSNYSMAFAIGLDVGDPSISTKLYDYIEMGFTAVTLTKKNGKVSKTKTNIPIYPCNYSSFFNQHNHTFDIVGLKNYFCPDVSNSTVEGIWTDDNFQYFEFSSNLK